MRAGYARVYCTYPAFSEMDLDELLVANSKHKGYVIVLTLLSKTLLIIIIILR